MPLPPFEQLKNDWNGHTIKFTLSPTLWQDAEAINTYFGTQTIKEIKFFNEDCTEINENITDLPNNKGGIYFFILKNKVLPNLSSHIMYIGRAHSTVHQNLRKRCREYFTKYYKDHTARPHIYIMLNNWSHHLHLCFIELTDNDDIDNIEEMLINNIVPPFNHDIPHPSIKKVKIATSAF